MNINWHNYNFTCVLALVPQTLLTSYWYIVNIIVVCTFLYTYLYLIMTRSTYFIIHCIKLKSTVYRMLQTVKLSKFVKNLLYHQCDMSRYFRFYIKLYCYLNFHYFILHDQIQPFDLLCLVFETCIIHVHVNYSKTLS